MDSEFYSTLTGLVKLGSAGVGVAILLMVFIMYMRGKPADDPAARLREKFLTHGLVFAAFCGILALVPGFVQSGDEIQRPVSMRLAFSPDFQSESLTPPKVRLPDGTISKLDEKFDLNPSPATQVLTIAMDATLKEVKSLRAASAALAESVVTVERQRNSLAERIASESPSQAGQKGLEINSLESESLQGAFARSLSRGDYSLADKLSSDWRDSVTNAESAVSAIARPAM